MFVILFQQLNTILNKKMEEMLLKIMMEENERLRRETYSLRTELFNSQEATITVSNSYTKGIFSTKLKKMRHFSLSVPMVTMLILF